MAESPAIAGNVTASGSLQSLLPDFKSRALAVIILVQFPCAVFFIGDVIADLWEVPGGAALDLHLIAEMVASLALLIAIAVETVFLLDLLRRQQATARSMAVAAGSLSVVMEEMFATWRLTGAERDVAAFVIKGLSISEIAQLRNAAEGTVKSQLNAIYRKADVTGRGQLVSLLIEDLMNAPLIDAPTGPDLNRAVD